MPVDPNYGPRVFVTEEPGQAVPQAVAANLASLNELIAEVVGKLGDLSMADPAFVRMATDVLRGHSLALGYQFQGERFTWDAPPAPEPPPAMSSREAGLWAARTLREHRPWHGRVGGLLTVTCPRGCGHELAGNLKLVPGTSRMETFRQATRRLIIAHLTTAGACEPKS